MLRLPLHEFKVQFRKGSKLIIQALSFHWLRRPTNQKPFEVMRHSLTHTTNSQRPYQCKKCDYGSATRDLLFVHLKKFHRSKPKSLVRREGKDFIIFHQVSLPKTQQDENGYFSCHICDFKTLHNSGKSLNSNMKLLAH